MVGAPGRRETGAAVANLQPHQLLVPVENDAEFASRWYAVQQRVGGQFRDAQLYVLDQRVEFPLDEDAGDEFA
ncbi:hypothetical protein GCM10010433_71540 [Streptomyces pulveraceus]